MNNVRTKARVLRGDTHVRRYAETDIPQIVEIVAREIPKLPNYRNVIVDPGRIRYWLDNNINNDGYFMVFVLVDPRGEVVGGIGAYCVTLAFSWDRACQDMFFFIAPEWRSLPNALKLMTAYKDWALARKATIIGATVTGGANEKGMERLLSMVGFEPLGQLYQYSQYNISQRRDEDVRRSTQSPSR